MIGPKMASGMFVKNLGQTWRRCAACGHHAMILPARCCSVCEGE